MTFSKKMKSLFIGALIFFFNFSLIHAQGVYPVFEVFPQFSIDDDAQFLGALGNRLVYFDKNGNDNELWVSDGTATGSFQIGVTEQEDIDLIARTNDTWYFAEDRGNEHHISTLSVGSDALVSLFSTDERIEKSLLWNGDIYFIQESATAFAADDLVKFDLTMMTAQVLFTSDFGGIRGLGKTSTDVMFVASMDAGKMVGKSDGTVANTQTFHKLYDAGSEFGSQVFMESDGDLMYFFYHPNNGPYNLWVTDGTSPNTQILKEYDHPSFGTATNPFLFHEGKFYFIMRNADAPSGTTNEIHVTDGTVNGTINLNPTPSNYTHPRQLRLYNNKVYFNSLDNNWALKSTDGTIAGTETVISPYGYQSGGVGQVYDNGLYNGNLILQARSNAAGSEIFTSDGTLNGTSLLADVYLGESNSYPTKFTQVGDLLFFSASLSNAQYLMVYDPNYSELPCADFAVTDTTITNISAGNPMGLGSIEVVASGGTGAYDYALGGVGSFDVPLFPDLAAGDYNLTITDAVGCQLQLLLTVENETSLINHSSVSSFELYPNPVGAAPLNIKMEFTKDLGQLDFVIHDLMGKLIYREKVSSIANRIQQQIPTTGFSSGKYILTVFSKNEPIVVSPFIVKDK